MRTDLDLDLDDCGRQTLIRSPTTMSVCSPSQGLPVFADLIRASSFIATDLATIPALVPKSSLRFILDGADAQAQPTLPGYEDCPASPTESLDSLAGVASKERKPRPANRMCKYEGCQQYVVDHGLCVRHGGGKRCKIDGCTSRAKHFGRCWKHGGSLECKISGCANRAKSKGYCWSHGGGTKCKVDACGKIAISHGLCWAHGGGKRCQVEGCMKQAYERTRNLCNAHYRQQLKRDAATKAE